MNIDTLILSGGGTKGITFIGVLQYLEEINILETKKIDKHAAELGSYFLENFRKSLEGVQGIIDIRGKGLMMAIELEKNCPDLVEKALNNKLLINVTSGNVIRLLPPLIMTKLEADQVVSILTDTLKKYLL